MRSLSIKIISECCELVKLCHINRRGPVFIETVYKCRGIVWLKQLFLDFDFQITLIFHTFLPL